MERITLAAFCLSPEFEADILAKYDVKIVNKTNAPWEVAFKGTPANLFAMQVEHFGKIEELRFGGYEVETLSGRRCGLPHCLDLLTGGLK